MRVWLVVKPVPYSKEDQEVNGQRQPQKHTQGPNL